MERGAWWAAVHGVTKSRTRLSIFTFTFHVPAMEKEMATHSSVLACKLWKIMKEMGIPDHLTCFLKTCMQVRKQQLELDMEQQTGSK